MVQLQQRIGVAAGIAAFQQIPAVLLDVDQVQIIEACLRIFQVLARSLRIGAVLRGDAAVRIDGIGAHELCLLHCGDRDRNGRIGQRLFDLAAVGIQRDIREADLDGVKTVVAVRGIEAELRVLQADGGDAERCKVQPGGFAVLRLHGADDLIAFLLHPQPDMDVVLCGPVFRYRQPDDRVVVLAGDLVVAFAIQLAADLNERIAVPARAGQEDQIDIVVIVIKGGYAELIVLLAHEGAGVLNDHLGRGRPVALGGLIEHVFDVVLIAARAVPFAAAGLNGDLAVRFRDLFVHTVVDGPIGGDLSILEVVSAQVCHFDHEIIERNIDGREIVQAVRGIEADLRARQHGIQLAEADIVAGLLRLEGEGVVRAGLRYAHPDIDGILGRPAFGLRRAFLCCKIVIAVKQAVLIGAVQLAADLQHLLFVGRGTVVEVHIVVRIAEHGNAELIVSLAGKLSGLRDRHFDAGSIVAGAVLIVDVADIAGAAVPLAVLRVDGQLAVLLRDLRGRGLQHLPAGCRGFGIAEVIGRGLRLLHGEAQHIFRCLIVRHGADQNAVRCGIADDLRVHAVRSLQLDLRGLCRAIGHGVGVGRGIEYVDVASVNADGRYAGVFRVRDRRRQTGLVRKRNAVDILAAVLRHGDRRNRLCLRCLRDGDGSTVLSLGANLRERPGQIAAEDLIVVDGRIERIEAIHADDGQRGQDWLLGPAGAGRREPVRTGHIGVFQRVQLAEIAGLHGKVQHVACTALQLAECQTDELVRRLPCRDPRLIGAENAVVVAADAVARHQDIDLRTDAVGAVRDVAELCRGVGLHPPVRLHHAGVAPLLAQDRRDGIIIVVAPFAVDLVVGGHQVVGLARLNADLKGTQVDLTLGALRGTGVDHIAGIFLIVERVMLRRCSHALTLQAADDRTGHQTGDHGIFGEIFEVSAAERIAVDIQAGSEQAFHAVKLHFLPDLLIQAFDQLIVPGAGLQRADRNKGGLRCKTKAGRAVAGGDVRDAIAAELLRCTGKDRGVAGRAGAGLHGADAAADVAELGGRELGDELIHRALAVVDVDELIALIAGHGNCLRQILQHAICEVGSLRLLRSGFPADGERAVPVILRDHAVKALAALDGVCLRELLGHAQGVERPNTGLFRRADGIADIDRIVAGLEDPGGLVSGLACIVIRGHFGDVEADGDRLGLAGSDLVRLHIANELLDGLAELALRRAVIDLNDFLARVGGAGVRHVGLDRYGIAVNADGRLDGKAGVAQAEAEGIEHLVRRKRFKVAVADVDVIHIIRIIAVAEDVVSLAGIVAVGSGDRIRQLAGGRKVAGEDVRHSVAHLDAALPYEQNGGDVFVIRRPRHVHDIADVHHDDDLLKVAVEHGQKLRLVIRQIVAALAQAGLMALACKAADHNGGNVRNGCGRFHGRLIHRHLVEVQTAVPGADVGGIFGAPLGVDPGKRFIEADAGVVLQALQDGDAVGPLDGASGAGAAVECIHLAAAKDGQDLAAERQRFLFVLQKNDALCGGLPGVADDGAIRRRSGGQDDHAEQHRCQQEQSQCAFPMLHFRFPFLFRVVMSKLPVCEPDAAVQRLPLVRHPRSGRSGCRFVLIH